MKGVILCNWTASRALHKGIKKIVTWPLFHACFLSLIFLTVALLITYYLIPNTSVALPNVHKQLFWTSFLVPYFSSNCVANHFSCANVKEDLSVFKKCFACLCLYLHLGSLGLHEMDHKCMFTLNSHGEETRFNKQHFIKTCNYDKQ